MKQFTEDLKIKIVIYYQSNSFESVKKIFNCSKRSVIRWSKIFNETNKIKRKERIHNPYKINTNFIKQLVNEIMINKIATIKELQMSLYIKTNILISKQHISRLLKQNKFTRKKVKHGHFPNTRYKIEINKTTELQKFYNTIEQFDINKIISIDETSLSLFMFRKYGFSINGTKCILNTNNNKVFTKHTFIGAITNNKLLKWELYEKDSINLERMLEFLTNLITQNNITGHLFVMDNVSSHKSSTIIDLIKNTNNFLLFTVPYNPQCNPIETWFSQFKYYLTNSTIRTFNKLKEDIQNVISIKIEIKHYNNYFNYAYNKKIYKK